MATKIPRSEPGSDVKILSDHRQDGGGNVAVGGIGDLAH